MAKNLVSENVVYEPTVRLKHRSNKKLDKGRMIVVSCVQGHVFEVKAATFFDKKRKGSKKIHACAICGNTLYVEE